MVAPAESDASLKQGAGRARETSCGSQRLRAEPGLHHHRTHEAERSIRLSTVTKAAIVMNATPNSRRNRGLAKGVFE